jgi:heptose I phosphotransferase
MDGASSLKPTLISQAPSRTALRSAPATSRRWTLLRSEWVAPQDRWWLEAYGLANLRTLLSDSFGDAPMVRWPHPMACNERRTLTLIRRSTFDWRRRAINFLSYGRSVTELRRDFEMTRRLKAAGLLVGQPLVYIEELGAPSGGCFMFESIPEAISIHQALSAQQQSVDAPRRQELLHALGRHVAELHSKGFVHGQLFAIHLLARDASDRWEIGTQAHGAMRQPATLGLRHRAADLASIFATLPERFATRDDRQRIVDSYIAEGRIASVAAELSEQIDLRVKSLLSHREIWEIRESESAEQLNRRRIDGAMRSHIWIDPEYRTHLESAGIASVPDMMNSQAGKQLRVLKNRENRRLEFAHPRGPRGAYLKKHHHRTLSTWLRAKLHRGPGNTEGRVEARNIAELNRAGIAAMRLVAFGESLAANGRLHSFVLTEELAGFAPLDDFIKRRFATVASKTLPDDHWQWRCLIGEVAALASNFHRLGYNHRDLYCCHFFVKEQARGQFQVNLIDLHRVEHRRRMRRRWIVKDLAQLAYSAPSAHVSCADRMAFLKRYLGVSKLGPGEKRLVRQVLAKQKLMEWQLGKHP